MSKRRILAAAVLLTSFFSPIASVAQPSRIIIVRHAEKKDAYALCDMGTLRADALAKEYLGRGAAHSLFAAADPPSAFLVMTMHTIDTVTPTVASWNMPAIAYTTMPGDDKKRRTEDEAENERTREAARDVMNDPAYSDKTVVMMWEHYHIADSKLEAEFAGQQVTLRQLLHLDRVAGVPKDWPDETYDYFWIVNYASGASTPTSFETIKQVFDAPFASLPANNWGEPEPRHIAAGCLK
jgi:hypothetical protein